MPTLSLIWNALWRGGAWGLLTGTLLGSVYGAIFGTVVYLFVVIAQDPARIPLDNLPRALLGMRLLPVIGSVVGALFGVPTGLIVGLIGGLLIGVLTRAFFYPLHDAARHRRATVIVSGIFTAAASWLCFVGIMVFYANRARANIPVLMLLVTIPALIAGAAGWLVAWHITRSYEHSANTPSGAL